MKVFAFAFSFEELNTNVFVNALMLTRSEDELFVAYCPKEFSPLFFGADLVIEIPDIYIRYSHYLEVAELPPRGRLSQLHFSICLYLINKFKIILKPRHLLTLSFLMRTARSSKYLFESGAWNWMQADARSRWGKSALKYGRVVHISDYFLVTPRELKFFRDLGQSFHFRFQELSNAIVSDLRIGVEETKKMEGGGIQKTVVIRTRNYQSKAPVHNSDPVLTLMICRLLLDRGYNLINIGSPPLPLDVSGYLNEGASDKGRSRYIEVDSPSLESELQTIMNSDFVVSRADAGLFTLISLVEKPIVALSEEWSTFLGVSLLDARKRSGQKFEDLSLGSSIDNKRVALSRLEVWINNLETQNSPKNPR